MVFLGSCVTTKTALKDFNNAEYYNAASKFQKVIKEGDSNKHICRIIFLLCFPLSNNR